MPSCACSCYLCSAAQRPAVGKRARGARQRGKVLIDISHTPDEPAAPAAVHLAPAVLGGKFWLTPEEVQALLRQYGVNQDEMLQLLIAPASQLARPPISSFRVG